MPFRLGRDPILCWHYYCPCFSRRPSVHHIAGSARLHTCQSRPVLRHRYLSLIKDISYQITRLYQSDHEEMNPNIRFKKQHNFDAILKIKIPTKNVMALMSYAVAWRLRARMTAAIYFFHFRAGRPCQQQGSCCNISKTYCLQYLHRHSCCGFTCTEETYYKHDHCCYMP